MKNYFKKRLKRYKQNQMISGVCAGLGNYLDIDPVIVRLIFAIGIVSTYPFFLLYIILWIITPYDEVEVKNYNTEKYSDEK